MKRVDKIKVGEREVMPLGVGTMFWGASYVDTFFGPPPTNDALEEVVRVAKQAGVTVYDTAEGYGGGASEERLAVALDNAGDPGKEELIMTKFLPAVWRWTTSQFFHSLEESRRRLGRPIQIYYIHTPMHPLFLTWIRCACEARKRGLVEEIGLSNCDAEQVEAAVEIAKELGQRIAVNQVLFSLLSYKSPQILEVERVCRKHNITIVAYSVLGQGLLTDNLTVEKFNGNRAAKMTNLKMEDLSSLRACIKQLSENYKVTMAQVCLNWAMQKGTIPLVGAKHSSHLSDAIGALNFSLSPSEVQQLDDAALDKSTLSKSHFRRSFFVLLISILIFCYYVVRWLHIAGPNTSSSSSSSSSKKEESQKGK